MRGFSSLRKDMNSAKMLTFVFLAGLLSLAFFILSVSNVYAVGAKPPLGSTVTTTALTAQSIRVTLVPDPTSTSTVWSFAYSTNNVTRTVVNVVTPTTTLTYDFTGLATNTAYYLHVASGDGMTTSSYASSSAVYTLAAAGVAPTVDTPATSSVYLTINAGSNPASTSYAIYNTTTGQFVGLIGTALGSATSSVDWRLSSDWNPGGGLQIAGLTPNTSYQFVVIPRNGDGVAAATSTASTATTTTANTPSSASVSAAPNGFNFTWSGDSTEYYAEDMTGGTNSGWITGTTFSVGGVNCGTNHSFRVKGRNGASVETGWSSTVSATTAACGSAIVVGVTIPAVPATPAVPGVSPAIPATPAVPGHSQSSVSLPPTASPVAVFVHTLRVGSKGEEVRALQAKLRELGYFKYPTDTGFFGGVTRSAVVAFQKAQGLKPFPGWVGPATRASLNSL